MAKVLTGISGNVISAASAAFAPTNSADVSAIASAYQVVSATATQLYAGTAYVTSVNDAPLSASRAGNAANASLANSAYYDGTGRLISSLPDSAAVSAIASAYAESAASSKQDTLTFGYDENDMIDAINGSALAGQGGGGSGSSPSGTVIVTDGTAIEATNSAIGTAEGFVVNNSGQASYVSYSNSYEHLNGFTTFKARGIGLTYNSSNATRTAWVSANTTLGNLASSFVLPASSVSAGGLLSTSNIDSIYDSRLKVDGGSLTLSGAYPVLFVTTGEPYSAVKELAWKDDIPESISLGLTQYNDYVTSLNNVLLSASVAGTANSASTAASARYDINSRPLTSFITESDIPSIASPSGTISVTDYDIEATNSAVVTGVFPGYGLQTASYTGTTVGPEGAVTATLPLAHPNAELVVGLGYGVAVTASAVFDGHTSTASAGDGYGLATAILKVPNATTARIYANTWRSVEGVSASALYGTGITGVGELAWASALPTYSYDAEDKISAINGSAIAGGGGGGGLVTAIGSLDGHVTSINSSDIVGRPSAVMTRSADENILQANEWMSMGQSTVEGRWFSYSQGINKVYLVPNHTSNDMSATAYDNNYNVVGAVPLTATSCTISSDTAVITRVEAQSDENGLSMYISGFKFIPSGDYIEALPSIDACVLKSASVVQLGTAATAESGEYAIKFAQGRASAGSNGFAFGSYVGAEYGVAFGSQVTGKYTSLAAGNHAYAYDNSIAVGDYVSAENTSMAQGRYVSASSNSFARGSFVSARNSATVLGTYNLSGDGSASSGAAFVIGDGTATAARHDLMVVTKDGEITMYSGTADTTGTGIMSSIRAISAAATGGGGVDSATVSAIASSYAESAVSSYQPLSGMSGYASAFSAGEGLEFVQSGDDQVLQVEAPVDIVAGPGIVIDNPDGNTLRVSQSTFGAWENITNQFTWASNATDNGVRCLYNSTLKLLWMQGYVHLDVGTSSTKVCTLPSSMKTQLKIAELSMASTLEEKHGLLSTNNDRTELHFKWITVPSNKYVGFFLICPMEEN